mgnify:FL=1
MKYLATLILASILLVSCSNHQQNGQLENEKLIKKYYQLFNNHQWIEMAKMYAPISEFKDPSLGQGIVKQSREDIVIKYAGLQEMFPNVKDEIVQIYPSDDKHLVVEFISKGTAADGSTLELPICTIFTIENGLITKDFTYYDNFESPEK